MKKRLLAIMSKKGKYLSEFKNNGPQILAYSAGWTNRFDQALTVDWDNIKDNDKNTAELKLWAEAVGGKLVVIHIDYKVAELDSGKEREEFQKSEEEDLLRGLLRKAFEDGFGGHEDED